MLQGTGKPSGAFDQERIAELLMDHVGSRL
jgi:hypothetical protein